MSAGGPVTFSVCQSKQRVREGWLPQPWGWISEEIALVYKHIKKCGKTVFEHQVFCCFFRLLGSFFSRPCKKHPREAKIGGCPGRLRSGPRDARSTPGAPRATQEAPGIHPRRDPGALLGATFGARWRKHKNAMKITRHEAQQGKAEQQSRSAPIHTPKRRASQAKRLARTSSSASVRTNTATANSGRTLSTACAATFQRIVRPCRLHLLGLPGRAFRPRANPGLTRRWAAGPVNFACN